MNPTSAQERALQTFRQHFAGEPRWLVRSPGRVNIIGEHTDYNDGYVLPMAIEQALWVYARPRSDSRVTLHSHDVGGVAEFDLSELEQRRQGWPAYVRAVALALQSEGEQLRGWEGALASDVPVGAGLSSSAALEVAAARIFAAGSDLPWDPMAMARIAQAAENKWVGVQCGIMDQMVCAAGKQGTAVLLDCRSLELQYVPLPEDALIALLDTSTRRELHASAYNERRSECAAAAAHFGAVSLRDVTYEQLQADAKQLDEEVYWRARHVLTESARTLQAAQAMRTQDRRGLGSLMYESHQSLRDDYEVSSPALDAIVECARLHPACLGARMTGAGFGGCAIALLDASTSATFADEVTDCYLASTGHTAKIYLSTAADGTELTQLA